MALKVGDKIQNFAAIDTNGDTFHSDTIVGKKPVVIYFYPKDDTPGCTIQACTFRDKYEDFKALGAEVIGISSDGLKSHQKFASRYKLPFILLSDLIKEHIENALDHKNLNLDVPEFADLNPTAENIAVFIWQKLRIHIDTNKDLEVVLYETPRNFVTYNGN